jgi:hypothetical protein
MSGTSMASPVTAGVAAAIWSYYPDLTAQQVKCLIEQSAVSYRDLKVENGEEGTEGKMAKFLSNPMQLSLGYAFIDDDGEPIKNLLDIRDSWSYPAFPASVQLGTKINEDWRGGLNFMYAKYNACKKNGIPFSENGNIWAVDASTLYQFYNLKLGPVSALKFSSIQGLGFTQRSVGNVNSTVTANTGLSIEYQICRDWHLQVSSQAKWGLNNYVDGGSYLQHGVGLGYTIPGKNTFGSFSKTGSVVNLYKALELAEKRYGK